MATKVERGLALLRSLARDHHAWRDAEVDASVLDADLWGYDDTDYRVLDNRMVVVRCTHECSICLGSIRVGDRVRAQREAWDGKVMTYYVCPACCRALARDAEAGDCLHHERRIAIGRQRQMARDRQP